jgi:phosphate-selective porin OprO/OprP
MNLLLRSAAAFALAVFAARGADAAEAANPSLAKEVEAYLLETKPEGNSSAASVEIKSGKGLTFQTADGGFSMHIGGRAYFDNGWPGSDDFNRTETQDFSFWRTIRLEVDGTFFTNAFFKIQMDFMPGTDVQLKDVYMGLKKLGFLGTLHVGHFKEPFSLEEQTSSRFTTFMERAAANAFAPGRNNGIMFNNDFLKDGLLGVFVGIFRDVNDQGNVAEDGAYNLTARVVAFFLHDKDTNRVLHVGAAFSLRDPNNEAAVQFRARPDIGTGPRFVDTGTIAAEDINLFNFEFCFILRTFHVQAEFFLTELSGGADASFSGFYVEAGWFIVGGQRTYSTSKKCIDRPKITQNFHAGKGGAGAWQFAVRFDTIDLNDGAVAGGVQDCVTIGVNWFWNPHMVTKFNVILADITDGGGPFGEGELTIFAMRFQFDF